MKNTLTALVLLGALAGGAAVLGAAAKEVKIVKGQESFAAYEFCPSPGVTCTRNSIPDTFEAKGPPAATCKLDGSGVWEKNKASHDFVTIIMIPTDGNGKSTGPRKESIMTATPTPDNLIGLTGFRGDAFAAQDANTTSISIR